MGEETTETALLKSDVENLKDSIRELRDTQSSHANARAEGRGARSFAKKYSSMAVGLMAALVSGLLWNQIQENEDNLTNWQLEGTVALERKNYRIKALSTRIGDLEEAKPVSTSGIKEKMVDVDARLRAIETDLSDDEGKFHTMTADIAAAQSNLSAMGANVTDHARELEKRGTIISGLQSSLSSVASSTQSAFVEVETQIRGVTDLNNTRFQEHWKIMTLMWDKTHEQALPEQEYHPNSIPAKANTTTGQISTNGKH